LSLASNFVCVSFGCCVLDFVATQICSEFHFPAARVAKIRFFVPIFPSTSCSQERAFKGVYFFLVFSLAADFSLVSSLSTRQGLVLILLCTWHSQISSSSRDFSSMVIFPWHSVQRTGCS
jgi:hypothetical protein